MNPKKLKKYYKLINLYPPLLGAGIRLKHVDKQVTRFVVEMKLRWYNRNVYGTHFGGSLYAMCDPFYVFIVHANFGEDYIFWDKSASIQYVKPGRGKVTGVFEIKPEKLSEMKKEVDAVGKKTYFFSTEITDESGEVVARVEKEVYIRKK